jgi:glycosyltransferase involved in cell wall biosynthesis
MSGMKTSVVITSCNGERYLGEQLRSIIDQSLPADEIVLGDDASTDTSLSIACAVLGPGPPDVHILTSETRLGIAANLTRCLERTTGDVVAFADQDDVWRRDKLARIASVLSEPSRIELVFSNGRVIGDDGRPTGRTLWAEVGFGPGEQRRWAQAPVRVLTRRTVVTGATMAARRSLVDAALPLPTSCWHDEWFTLGAVLRGTTPVPIADTLIDYRVHGRNQTGLPPRRFRERLAQAGWPRDHRLDAWQAACERFGPDSTPASKDASAHLEGAVALARERPGRTTRPLERLSRVAALGLGGGYRRYGQGWRMALHDLISPALYGRE